MTLTTRVKLEALALAEGWKMTNSNVLNHTFVRGDTEVTVGYRRGSNNRAVLSWCALFQGGQPVARYGLFAAEGPGTGSGEIVLNVKHKAKIVTDWLTS